MSSESSSQAIEETQAGLVSTFFFTLVLSVTHKGILSRILKEAQTHLVEVWGQGRPMDEFVGNHPLPPIQQRNSSFNEFFTEFINQFISFAMEILPEKREETNSSTQDILGTYALISTFILILYEQHEEWLIYCIAWIKSNMAEEWSACEIAASEQVGKLHELIGSQ